MILLPQRRGVGQSGGSYREGFNSERNEYSCDPDEAIAGFEHAMEDMRHITTHVLSRPDIDADRLVLAGQSRGGALAMAQAAREPDAFAGVFSFVGGWMGRGCEHYVEINQKVYANAGNYEKSTLWFHGSRDRFYGLKHCQEIFDTYRAEGGQGSFESYKRGHFLIAYQEHYQEKLKEYLDSC